MRTNPPGFTTAPDCRSNFRVASAEAALGLDRFDLTTSVLVRVHKEIFERPPGEGVNEETC